MKENIKQKQLQLKWKKQQKLKNIELIKSLRQQIEALKWRIPSTGVNEDIEELKQSIKVPLSFNKQQDATLQKIIEEQSKRASKQADNALITFLQNKKQMLQKMDKLRVDGNLYQSHRRVLLKQYLEMLRASTKKQKIINQGLEKSGLQLQNLKKQYEKLLQQTNKTSQQLVASRLY